MGPQSSLHALSMLMPALLCCLAAMLHRPNQAGEFLARHAVHMDCLHWVNRDSYLPQGSRGLKVGYGGKAHGRGEGTGKTHNC